jgi:hypothetical protein
VFDIELTTYGRHKLSSGKFKPTFYSFFDDNVLYDIKYAGGSEEQNNIHKRIKEETQYLEGQTIFQQILSGSVVRGGILEETIYQQDENLFTSDGFIGDAKLLAESEDVAPAWKFISMKNNLSSINQQDLKNKFKVPQINITASYILKSKESLDIELREDNLRSIISRTPVFSDGRLLQLESNDPLIYLEEMNTELLTSNFDIEVFQVIRGETDDDFRRLYFNSKTPQVQDGFMISEKPIENTNTLTTASVEYYFSILADSNIEPKMACKYVNQFNSENYLVDLDFDCSDVEGEDMYFDIYGRVTESEICPD